MANETSGAYFTANAVVDKTAAGTFIPEIWSDEVIAAYQKNLKMAPLVKRIAMTGKKGDRLHIPKPTRGSASAKSEATAVTIQANLESELTVDVDRHFEYSRLIEDIVEVQALNSLRQFYTEDAGYALALQIDNDLHSAATGFGDGTKTFSPTATGSSYQNSGCFFNDNGTTTQYTDDTVVVGDVFTDAFLRDMIQKLDDNDVPMDGRKLIIPPSVRNAIMGEDRFSSSDFVSGQPVNTGLIGNLYGVDVYVSSNCRTIETAANNSAGGDVRAALLFHTDAMVMAEQQAVRSQTQYKQEYLSTLYTADCLYGIEVYRPEAGFVMAIPE
jgi:N4-gp56 family major capsid protein